MMASTTSPVNIDIDSNPTPFISSSPETGFVPRKEFASSTIRQPSSFALLSFSSNNVIRVTNFDRSVFLELNARLHSVIGLRAFRENAEHKLGEIVLLGKPWSNARSLSTEIVIIQAFTIVLRFGYTFISQIDYGREPNDRITLVFSKVGARTSLDSEEKSTPSSSQMVPFGLSFTSATSLRVVCSPLTGTPAILQSIRGAWPKGVKAEKKLGEHCYEFKLKGYSCTQMMLQFFFTRPDPSTRVPGGHICRRCPSTHTYHPVLPRQVFMEPNYLSISVVRSFAN